MLQLLLFPSPKQSSMHQTEPWQHAVQGNAMHVCCSSDGLSLSPWPGMEVYPSRTQLPELLPQPVLAGVIGGICFLSVAVIFSTMAACIMNRRRAARIQKRRQGGLAHGTGAGARSRGERNT